MNNKELQAARKLLCLSVAEAAKHIGKVTPRSWQKRDRGENRVPNGVEEKIIGLLQKRLDMISATDDLIAKDGTDKISYLTFNEHITENSDLVDCRLSQSVAAHYFGKLETLLN